MTHAEEHKVHKIVWLRAAVLGANDGILSISSLLIGVAAANASHIAILVAGVAGVVAGVISMAAGEYVSVSSQSDIEQAERKLERKHIRDDYEMEKKELADIYKQRGLDATLATEVADKLMKHDALAAQCRDELGLSETLKPKPIQAALYSGFSFTSGAILPLFIAVISPIQSIPLSVSVISLVALGLLGVISAHVGGTNKRVAVTRIIFWGAFAMGATALIGLLFGIVT